MTTDIRMTEFYSKCCDSPRDSLAKAWCPNCEDETATYVFTPEPWGDELDFPRVQSVAFMGFVRSDCGFIHLDEAA